MTDTPISPRCRWLTFIAAGIMLMLVNLDATVVSIALPTIARHFHSNIQGMAWMINGYTLIGAIFFVVSGRLAELYGPKKVFLTGIVLFVSASLACAFAPNEATLIIARLVQGSGFAFTLGLSILIVKLIFPPEQTGKVIGALTIITGVSQALGPTMGGIIVSQLTWPWIFAINIPLGIISFLMTLRFCPKLTAHHAGTAFDYKGTIILAILLGSWLIGLNEFHRWQFTLPTFVYFIIGLLALALLIIHLRITANPLIAKVLLHCKQYWLIITVRATMMTSWAGLLFCLPLMLQNIWGYSALHTGFILLSMTMIFSIVSYFAGRLIDSVGFETPLSIAAIIGLIAFFIATHWSMHTSLYGIILVLLLVGMMGGIHIPSSIAGALQAVPHQSHGSATGLFFTVAFFFASVGTAITGLILSSVSMHLFLEQIASLKITLPTIPMSQISPHLNGAQSVQWLRNHMPLEQSKSVIHAAQASFMGAMRVFMWVNVALSIIAIAACFKLKNSQGCKS